MVGRGVDDGVGAAGGGEEEAVGSDGGGEVGDGSVGVGGGVVREEAVVSEGGGGGVVGVFNRKGFFVGRVWRRRGFHGGRKAAELGKPEVEISFLHCGHFFRERESGK